MHESFTVRLTRQGAWLLGLLVCLGCAATYQIMVNGYTDPAAQVRFAPGARFCVVDNQKAANPLLEKEIRAKIQRMLTLSGFSLAPSEQAEYLLLFTYGIGPGASSVMVAPEWGVGFGGGGRYWGGGYAFFWPGFTTYSTAAVYDRWLLLNVVSAREYREGGQARPLWVGESRSSGTSADLREAVDALLVAAFQQFGRNTGKAVTAELHADDSRLQQLRQLR